MNIIDRFTRDRVSRFVWGGLTIACLAVATGAQVGQSRAVRNEEDAAVAFTHHVADTTVYENVIASKIGEPIHFYYRPFYSQLAAEVLTDPRVARVRVYDTEGFLRFTTERGQQSGLQVTDPGVDAASSGGDFRRKVAAPFTSSTVGGPGVTETLLQTYAPLRAPDRLPVLGAVEVDYHDDLVVAAADQPWHGVQIAFLILAALCAVMTLLSLRAPTETVGAGVAALERIARPRDQGERGEDGSLDEELAAESASPLVARVTQREAERVASVRAEADELRGELQAAHEQLTQAEEAYRYLETRLKQVQEQVSSQDESAGAHNAARLSELEEALRSSEAEREQLKSGASASDAAVARLAALEELRREAEERARSAEERSARFEMELTEMQAQTKAAAPPEPAPEAAPEPEDLLAQLEERVAAAERRARETEERLANVEVSPQAQDLRARLARTAARKRMSAEELDASGAAEVHESPADEQD